MKAGLKLGKSQFGRGFSLLEMMFVVAVILILASFAIPGYSNIALRAREAVLRDDLFTMRAMIDRFTLDEKRPPESLDELVTAGYLRGGIPTDPISRENATGVLNPEDASFYSRPSGDGNRKVANRTVTVR